MSNKSVLVCVKTGASDADIVKAVLQGAILLEEPTEERSSEELMRESLSKASRRQEEFQALLDGAGWTRKVVRGAWNTIDCSEGIS